MNSNTEKQQGQHKHHRRRGEEKKLQPQQPQQGQVLPQKVVIASPSKVQSKESAKVVQGVSSGGYREVRGKEKGSLTSTTTTSTSVNGGGFSTSSIGHVASAESIKIIQKTLKLNKSGIEELRKLLRDNENFMVIGAVGSQSSGKSSILSALAMRDLVVAPGSKSVPFTVQTESSFSNATHQTDGIDVYVDQRDGIIYIDSQPLDSISILCELIEKNVNPVGNLYLSVEHYHHLQSIKIVIFLMSICNILLVVQENKSLDLSTYKIIRTAMMLKNKIPDISQPNLNPSQLVSTYLDSDQSEFRAKLVCIFNKLNELDYDMKPIDKVMSNLLTNPRDTHQIYPPSNAILNTTIDCFQLPEKKITSSTTTVTTTTTSTSTASTSTNPLPSSILSPSASAPTNTQFTVGQLLYSPVPLLSPNKYYPTFNESIKKLKHRLILFKSTSKFNKPIKETDWLENAIKIWDSIQTSDAIETYTKQIRPLFSIGLPTSTNPQVNPK